MAIKTEHPQNQLRREKIQSDSSNNAANRENELEHLKLLLTNKKGDWVGNAKKTRPGNTRPSRHLSITQRIATSYGGGLRFSQGFHAL